MERLLFRYKAKIECEEQMLVEQNAHSPIELLQRLKTKQM